MIESVKASNFQSLQNVELQLGKFTVIVGASSSGKSAFTRALKAVASNALGSDNITKGAKTASVTVKTDRGTVTIERTGGNSAYKVITTSGKEPSFTKLNRQVPTEVTEVLGITPSTKELESINFAGQFDAPYLLKDGSSSVARVLGELTNVSTIFAAVKEASKRAKNASTLLNLRKKDLDSVKIQIADYANINVQAKQITDVEQRLAECVQLEAKLAKLRDLVDRAEMASQALSQVQQISKVPDMQQLLEAQLKLNRFKNLLRQLGTARAVMAEQKTSITDAESAILQAETDLHETLVAAGTCPLCNQEIEPAN